MRIKVSGLVKAMEINSNFASLTLEAKLSLINRIYSLFYIDELTFGYYQNKRDLVNVRDLLNLPEYPLSFFTFKDMGFALDNIPLINLISAYVFPQLKIEGFYKVVFAKGLRSRTVKNVIDINVSANASKLLTDESKVGFLFNSMVLLGNVINSEVPIRIDLVKENENVLIKVTEFDSNVSFTNLTVYSDAVNSSLEMDYYQYGKINVTSTVDSELEINYTLTPDIPEI